MLVKAENWKKKKNQINYAFLIIRFLYTHIQWNLSKADTYGTEVSVHFREVSALERFELKSFQI